MSEQIEFVATNDGSNTLYSKEYNQHYHNRQDGALNEALSKHVIPALNHHKSKKKIVILDICYGLGYNTLATLYYIKQNNLDVEVEVYSPELDTKLLHSLENFEYPEEFETFSSLVKSLSKEFTYKDSIITIELYNGDAREYLHSLIQRGIHFDIVYQDAFSSEVNHTLWTKEYFQDVSNLLKEDGIVTTYSIATPVRLSMYENGLEIYEILNEKNKKSTIALKQKDSDKYKYIDMELKKQRNPIAQSLKD